MAESLKLALVMPLAVLQALLVVYCSAAVGIWDKLPAAEGWYVQQRACCGDAQ
jgi:hypothetical protein